MKGRLLTLFISAGLFLSLHIWRTNALTKIQLEIPILEERVKELARENSRLQLKVDELEAPQRLFELARRPEFFHLTFPSREDILFVDKR